MLLSTAGQHARNFERPSSSTAWRVPGDNPPIVRLSLTNMVPRCAEHRHTFRGGRSDHFRSEERSSNSRKP